MAQAYPNSEFFGFDYHGPSIDRAQVLAKEAGLQDRITYAKADAKTFPAKDYSLVAFFDCLHDMGDPVGAGRHVKDTLAPDGVWMIVEPMAHDDLKDNLNPVGRVYYGASTSSALRHHCLKKWRWGWAPRPASDAYGKLSLRLDLPSSGGQPKRHSI